MAQFRVDSFELIIQTVKHLRNRQALQAERFFLSTTHR